MAAGGTVVGGAVAGGGVVGGPVVDVGLIGVVVVVVEGARVDSGFAEVDGGGTMGGGVVEGGVAVRLMGTTYPIGAESLPASGVTPEAVCAVGFVCAAGLVGAVCVGATAVGLVAAGAGGDVVGDATIGPLCDATRPSGGTIIGPGPARRGMFGAAVVTFGPAARSTNGAGAEAGIVVGSSIAGGVATLSGGRGRARLEGPAVGAFFAFPPGAWPSVALLNDGPAITFVGNTAGLTVAGPTTTRTGVDSSAMVRRPSAAMAVTPPISVIAAVPSATTLSRRRSDAVSSVGIRP